MHIRYADITPYVTKDGSLIRELMHPDRYGAAHPPAAPEAAGGNLSLAEATVAPGAATVEHVHDAAEEIYHFTSGAGAMALDGREFPVAPGDTVRIAPGRAHAVRNDGPEPLVFLCCCAPPYTHDDTRAVNTAPGEEDRP